MAYFAFFPIQNRSCKQTRFILALLCCSDELVYDWLGVSSLTLAPHATTFRGYWILLLRLKSLIGLFLLHAPVAIQLGHRWAQSGCCGTCAWLSTSYYIIVSLLAKGGDWSSASRFKSWCHLKLFLWVIVLVADYLHEVPHYFFFSDQLVDACEIIFIDTTASTGCNWPCDTTPARCIGPVRL